MMTSLTTCSVICSDTGKTAVAEILSKNDKFIKVVISGTNITLSMSRDDVRKPYVGKAVGMEFTTYG